MTDLFWPGGERAGDLMTSAALLQAMTEVERVWLDALVAANIAPAEAGGRLAAMGDVSGRVAQVAAGSEAGGNPVIALVKLLRQELLVDSAGSYRVAGSARTERPTEPVTPEGPARPEGLAGSEELAGSQGPVGSERLEGPEGFAGSAGAAGAVAAKWLHRGLTSQDVMDTGLMLCLRDVLARVRGDLGRQIQATAALASAHRHTPMAGRTLTQHAVPTTFGAKAAQWLTALLDARDVIDRLPPLPVQLGGAAGTLSAVLELARRSGSPHPNETAVILLQNAANQLELDFRSPWHTARGPVTAIGDALVGCCDAWGRIARDVIELGRPEIAELGEPAAEGRGGSSTMAQKRNPVLSVLIRRSALSAPQYGATLHLAAAEAVDERPDGSWHAEWPALQSLSRASVSAGSQATELLEGLRVDPERMRANLDAAGDAVLAEQRSMADLFDEQGPGGDYFGLVDLIVDAALNRAEKGKQ